MRRPPEVGQAALYLVLLLGLSGCAGFPQRSTGSSPWETGSDQGNASPPGLFSWWHRSTTQTGAAPSSSSETPEAARPSQDYAQATQAAANPWPETQSEWMARNFPRFNRLWNGTPAAIPPRPTDTNGVTWTNRMRDRAPAADVAEKNSADSGETDGALRTSFQPDADGAKAAQTPSRAAETDSSAGQSPAVPPALPDILPAPTLAGPRESATAEAAVSPATSSSPGSSEADGQASNTEPPASLDSRLAQVPPAPPPVQRTPPAPAPSGANPSAASPPTPPAATPDASAPVAAPAASTPAAANPTQATPAPPSATIAAPAAPTTAQTPAPAVVSAQRPIFSSGQSIYASPPPMAPAQPRHHLFGWLFHDDDDNASVASGQAPPTAFPTMFSSPQNVAPAGQGSAAGCETAACSTKKPCFLKVWIADWKNGHGSSKGDCGHGGPCASAQTDVTACDSGSTAPKKPCFLKVWIADWKSSHGSGGNDCGHGGVCASPQGSAAACETTVSAPKKPCFLKVWMADWKNSHGCGGCEKGGGTSGQACKYCGAKAPVTGSAQGGLASPQGASAQTAGAAR
jgi:hypothetical protein